MIHVKVFEFTRNSLQFTNNDQLVLLKSIAISCKVFEVTRNSSKSIAFPYNLLKSIAITSQLKVHVKVFILFI